jgi:hypothetical protein
MEPRMQSDPENGPENQINTGAQDNLTIHGVDNSLLLRSQQTGQRDTAPCKWTS